MRSRLFRVMAVLLIGVTLLLSFSASSPELHALWHAHHQDEGSNTCCAHHDHGPEATDEDEPKPSDATCDGEGCPVAWFAHGLVTPAWVLYSFRSEPTPIPIGLRATEHTQLKRPQYLLLPSRAPPAA